jgi:hypothetical protein
MLQVKSQGVNVPHESCPSENGNKFGDLSHPKIEPTREVTPGLRISVTVLEDHWRITLTSNIGRVPVTAPDHRHEERHPRVTVTTAKR